MHWIYLIHEFHNLSWITEINELFHDILIYWDTPVYMQRYHFFRSDPENSEYRPIPIRVQVVFFVVFFKSMYSFYTSVSLFCVLNNLLDNLILMKSNMKIYIGAVYTWSLVMRFVI